MNKINPADYPVGTVFLMKDGQKHRSTVKETNLFGDHVVMVNNRWYGLNDNYPNNESNVKNSYIIKSVLSICPTEKDAKLNPINYPPGSKFLLKNGKVETSERDSTCDSVHDNVIRLGIWYYGRNDNFPNSQDGWSQLSVVEVLSVAEEKLGHYRISCDVRGDGAKLYVNKVDLFAYNKQDALKKVKQWLEKNQKSFYAEENKWTVQLIDEVDDDYIIGYCQSKR